MKIILSASSFSTTAVKIKAITPEYMLVEYSTVPNNTPHTFGNFVQVWQDTAVEWNNPSGGWKQAVSVDSVQGDLAVPVLVQNKAYMCGYSVGESVQNICATAVVYGANPNQQDLFSTRIAVAPAQDSLLVDYVTPDGCQPSTFGHWVGLFNGGDNPYVAPPLTLTPVNSTASSGSVPLFYSMSAGRSYLVAYYAGGAGGDQSGVACTLQFTAGD